ncbi:MAG: hypothetical protein KJ667_01245 [Alphaproteobacteria bacterium]|nr:hypothetical protein [Alphaproteobacteria bacterium]
MVNLKGAINEFRNAGEVLGQNNPFANGSMGATLGLTQIAAPAATVAAPQPQNLTFG